MGNPFGLAITDFFYNRKPSKLWIYNTYGPREEMPVAAYFRDFNSMPLLEHVALEKCTGKILDIGAGAGSHALCLQQQGKDITALEINLPACEVMRDRGVKQIIRQDVFEFTGERFDTLLLLMNGIGLTGTLAGLHRFLQHARNLLNPGGQLIFDSSDVAYVYEGHFPDLTKYYGEIAYRYAYKKEKTDWFNWLYIDRYTLSAIAAEEGWVFEYIMEDAHGQYLVKLQLQ